MNMQRLLRISRPRFWIYSLGPYVLGVAAAMRIHTYNTWPLLPLIVFFIFFTYPANIFTYGANDISDYETDRLNPKKIAYESLVLPKERLGLWTAITISSLPFIVYAYIALPRSVTASLIFFFICAAAYSIPPIRAKARPFIDSLVSGLHYVSPAIMGYILGMSSTNSPLSYHSLVVCVLSGFLWSAAMHAFSAIPDIDADKKANVATIATVLGKNKTLLFCITAYVVATILILPFLGMLGIFLGILYIGIMAYTFQKNEKEVFTIYTHFPTINTLAGMIVTFFVFLK